MRPRAPEWVLLPSTRTSADDFRTASSNTCLTGPNAMDTEASEPTVVTREIAYMYEGHFGTKNRRSSFNVDGHADARRREVNREEDLLNHSWCSSESDRQFKPSVHRNLGFEKFRYRTTGLSCFDGSFEYRLVRIRNLSQQVEMALRDREMLADLLESDGRRGCQLLGSQTYLTQLRGNRHRKACRMCGSQKFFGVGTDAISKSRTERILHVLQDSALCR